VKKIVHVVGARPNYMKIAPLMDALARHTAFAQVLVNTGQHYDDNMAGSFFSELQLPRPDRNLGVGSGSHAAQTARVMTGFEEVCIEERPDLVVVVGDVNSTMAAALVAAKLVIPIAHVEAGLRSFDRTMPEEINRIVTDRLADVLFATSADAVAHLGREGVAAEQIFLVGNPMIDTLLANLELFDVEAARRRFDLTGDYVVSTLHRPSNVDDDVARVQLVRAIHRVADQVPVVLPLHPRGRAPLQAAGLFDHPRLRVLDPLGYVDFLSLVRGASAVVTDSGGVQEETTLLGVPCLTLRPNTERPVTITDGTNELVTADALPQRMAQLLASGRPTAWNTPPLWDGRAGERIARVIAERLRVD
jgi:UDP-N-acetylglucosamine 2-epimerase (non-hydrolysing)